MSNVRYFTENFEIISGSGIHIEKDELIKGCRSKGRDPVLQLIKPATAKIHLCIFFFLTTTASFAQTNDLQAWWEYILQYPFANVYNLEYNFRYSTEFGNDRWSSLQNRLTIGRAVGGNGDLTLTEMVAYTKQKESYNTLELRTTLGFRYHFTPNSRVQTRLNVRLENRQLKDLDTKDWTSTNRFRIRPEVIFPITSKTMFTDEMLYGIVDGEWFIPIDKDQEETFANRFRSRIGVGYRLNYTWRFELIYSLQRSRDTIDDAFEPSADILRFRVKHFLRRSKPKDTVPESDH